MVTYRKRTVNLAIEINSRTISEKTKKGKYMRALEPTTHTVVLDCETGTYPAHA